MKRYGLAVFLCMVSYQMQSFQVHAAYDKPAILKAKLDAVKKSSSEFFQAQIAFSQPPQFPIQPSYEHALCEKIVDANRRMHEDTIRFIRFAYDMKKPDFVDCRLLTPRCVLFCMKELQKRPSTPRSRALVEEFFEVKKPWLHLQEAYKQAIAVDKSCDFSEEEK